jgi:hypothetical protein
MEFEVGNPPQRSVLKVDTGSSSIGFEKDKPCNLYGSYNNLTSTTAVYIRDCYTDFLQDYGYGSFINDTIRFSDHTVADFTLGTLDVFYAHFYLYPPVSGILGLGGECINSQACDDYPTLVQQLYDQKILKTRAFSIYLEPDNGHSTGTLLLGGVDRAKQRGPIAILNYSISNYAPYNVNFYLGFPGRGRVP